MNIKKILNDVGAKVFIDFFELFNSTLENYEVVEKLPEQYTEKSRKSRTSKARKIIKEGYVSDALEYILNSKRMDFKTQEKAKKIKNNLF